MTQSTPNTRGASWEETKLLELAKLPGVKKMRGAEKDVNDFLDSLLVMLSKERAEGERRGRNEFADRVVQDLLKMESVPGPIGGIARTAADFVLDTLNEYEATLPEDSTEEV